MSTDITTPARTALSSDVVSRGSMAASCVPELAIRSSDDDRIATDYGTAIAAALKHLEAERTKITQPLNSSLRSINALFAGPKQKLEMALRSLNAKQLSWKQAEAARIERERVAAQAAADAATARAAEEAQVWGEEPPPPASVPQAQVATITRGTAGNSAHVTRTLRCEMIDPHECDPSWLRLDEAAAKESYRAAVDRGEVIASSEYVTWRGVRWRYEAGLARRG